MIIELDRTLKFFEDLTRCTTNIEIDDVIIELSEEIYVEDYTAVILGSFHTLGYVIIDEVNSEYDNIEYNDLMENVLINIAKIDAKSNRISAITSILNDFNTVISVKFARLLDKLKDKLKNLSKVIFANRYTSDINRYYEDLTYNGKAVCNYIIANEDYESVIRHLMTECKDKNFKDGVASALISDLNTSSTMKVIHSLIIQLYNNKQFGKGKRMLNAISKYEDISNYYYYWACLESKRYVWDKELYSPIKVKKSKVLKEDKNLHEVYKKVLVLKILSDYYEESALLDTAKSMEYNSINLSQLKHDIPILNNLGLNSEFFKLNDVLYKHFETEFNANPYMEDFLIDSEFKKFVGTEQFYTFLTCWYNNLDSLSVKNLIYFRNNAKLSSNILDTIEEFLISNLCNTKIDPILKFKISLNCFSKLLRFSTKSIPYIDIPETFSNFEIQK